MESFGTWQFNFRIAKKQKLEYHEITYDPDEVSFISPWWRAPYKVIPGKSYQVKFTPTSLELRSEENEDFVNVKVIRK